MHGPVMNGTPKGVVVRTELHYMVLTNCRALRKRERLFLSPAPILFWTFVWMTIDCNTWLFSSFNETDNWRKPLTPVDQVIFNHNTTVLSR